MTVRVNKPAFNIREKLSELERPIGVKGSELMKSETVQDARDLVSAGRKNIIFNGNMIINQRGTSFTVNGSANPYTLDRWAVRRGDISSLTVTKNTSTGLDSHPNALKVECTANASQAAGTDTWIRYVVEDVDSNSILNYPNSNKSLTLSFWVRANVAGQYSASITSGDFGDRFIHAFTVNANTWEYKSFTIPPPSLWGTSGGYGLRVYFDLGSGSNYQNSTFDQWIYGGSTYAASGNTRVTGVNGRTFEITGVQLEVGRNATEFEHRSYGEELALCQRYYEKFSADDANGGYATFCKGGKASNTVIVLEPVFRVPKRAPGATMSWGGSFRFGGVGGVTSSSLSSIQNQQLGTHGGYIVLVTSSNASPPNGGDGYRFEGDNDTSAFIAFSSEL